jgi:glutamate N-acetyltransferase/amino-acid N-acetyltransferase
MKTLRPTDLPFGVTAADGYRAAGVHCGIKTSAGAPDLALLVADRGCSAAGVFTVNRASAAPVHYCRGLVNHPPEDGFRAIVVNSGVANAATGARGEADTRETSRLVSDALGVLPEQVLVCSTGVIGRFLPMDCIARGIRDAAGQLEPGPGGDRAARAIMTTDTRPKQSAYRAEVGGTAITVGGMAKGAGMIEPNMATMLAFITTDLALPTEWMQEQLRWAVDQSFNCITIDHDTSTNDTVLLLSPRQKTGVERPSPEVAEGFRMLLLKVCTDLALAIMEDGEGVHSVVKIMVTGAASTEDARLAGRRIANSPLIKCSWNTGDPNWGRIVAAIGNSGADFNMEKLAVRYGDQAAFDAGAPVQADRKELAKACKHPRWTLHVDLGVGDAEGFIYGCDLSKEYVQINIGES